MRRWATLACFALFVIAWVRLHAIEPSIERGIFQIQPPTPYLHLLPNSDNRGPILVVHGLGASKELMRIFALAAADAGFEVYAIDLPGHGDSPIGFTYDRSREAVEKVAALLESRIAAERIRRQPELIVVGHSLGGALLADLADSRKFSTIVLFSPAPIPIGQLRTERLLIVTGSLDIPGINEFVPSLIDEEPTDAAWWTISGTMHTTALFSQRQTERVVQWLGGVPDRIRTTERLACWIALIGSGLLAGVSLLAGLGPAGRAETGRQSASFARPPAHETPARSRTTTTLVLCVAACSLTLLLLKVVVVLSWIRLFATDYLASFLLIAGLLLWQGRGIATSRHAVLVAVLAAMYLIAMAIMVGSYIVHTGLTEGRWWRFPVLAVSGFPFFMFDEIVVRRIGSRSKRVGIALLTRALLGAFVVDGVLLLNVNDGFLALIMHLVVLFWIGLWFATGIIHRATDDPVAAALFATLVQGWLFAATFVTI